MTYFLNLFSPETYEAFSQSDRRISGFRPRQRIAASKIHPGDRFICYMTRLSRWIGVLEVEQGPFDDDAPLFYKGDPFIVRFMVTPIAWLDREKAIPIHEDEIWDVLSFTKGHDKKSSTWTGKIRASLVQMGEADGRFLEELIRRRAQNGRVYEIDEGEYQKHVTHRVQRLGGVVSVAVPEETTESESSQPEPDGGDDIRESLKIQALIADIGSKMGMKIWVPRNDRDRIQGLVDKGNPPLLGVLPLNYDDTMTTQRLKRSSKSMFCGYRDEQSHERSRLNIRPPFTRES